MKILSKLSIVFLLIFLVILIFYPFFIQQDSLYPLAANALLKPSWQHLFGTDSLGRDFFSRVILAARLSFFIGFCAALIAFVFGAFIGTISGYFGGVVDSIIMRLVELLMSLPQLITVGFVLLFFQSSFGEAGWVNIFSLILGMGLATWMLFARMVRAEILKEKNLPYVEAARAVGASPLRILFRHIYPQIFSSMGVVFILQLPQFFLLEGFLSFVGIGVQPPLSSWGGLLYEGWKVMRYYPHLMFFPSILLFLTIFSFHILFQKSKKISSHRESANSQI